MQCPLTSIRVTPSRGMRLESALTRRTTTATEPLIATMMAARHLPLALRAMRTPMRMRMRMRTPMRTPMRMRIRIRIRVQASTLASTQAPTLAWVGTHRIPPARPTRGQQILAAQPYPTTPMFLRWTPMAMDTWRASAIAMTRTHWSMWVLQSTAMGSTMTAMVMWTRWMRSMPARSIWMMMETGLARRTLPLARVRYRLGMSRTAKTVMTLQRLPTPVVKRSAMVWTTTVMGQWTRRVRLASACTTGTLMEMGTETPA